MFRERARGSEFLDRPDADPRFVAESYRFMKVVNRIGGGIRVVRRFLESELSQSPRDAPVTVLDIGAGDCDIPLAVARWAGKRGYKVRFTCLDHDPKAVELSQSRIARCRCDNVQAVQADVFTYKPADKFDYAMGSMTFHHFTDEEIDRLIEHLRGFVRKAVLINDLHRCLANYVVCFILVLPLGPEIRHDALLSIRRGFKPRELQPRLAQHEPAAVVRRMWFCRVAGVVRFDESYMVSFAHDILGATDKLVCPWICSEDSLPLPEATWTNEFVHATRQGDTPA